MFSSACFDMSIFTSDRIKTFSLSASFSDRRKQTGRTKDHRGVAVSGRVTQDTIGTTIHLQLRILR